jgi:hypothetical protein
VHTMSNGRAKNGLAARCLATGGMASRVAALGAARGWRWSGRFIGSACATMLIVAAPGSPSRFREAKTPDRSSRPHRNQGCGCHCSHCSTSGAHVSRSDVPTHDTAGPVPPPPARYVRALAWAAPTSTPTRAAGSRTAQRSPSTLSSGTSRCRTESPSWFAKQALALTGTYPSTS